MTFANSDISGPFFLYQQYPKEKIPTERPMSAITPSLIIAEESADAPDLQEIFPLEVNRKCVFP